MQRRKAQQQQHNLLMDMSGLKLLIVIIITLHTHHYVACVLYESIVRCTDLKRIIFINNNQFIIFARFISVPT